MNIFILKTMRYLDNPELFASVEMWENANAAWAVVDNDANYAAYAAVYAAAKAANYATTAYAAVYAHANYWIDKYFKITKENKQDYINEVERLK